jgi:formylglycine-generating enzyme required for sulfatase activity
VRGFSFAREVQPVLDKHCVSCHNGQPGDDGKTLVDLRGDQNALVVFKGGDPRGQVVHDTPKEKLLGKYGGVFEPSYLTLRSLVRAAGFESDLHQLPAMEFHADTTELVQMLRKGHYGVNLDDEAWDRLVTWIDLNAPCHGTWAETTRIQGDQQRRRCELRKLYGGVEEDAEELPEHSADRRAPEVRRAPGVSPGIESSEPRIPGLTPGARQSEARLLGWPFDAAEAARRQQAGGPSTRTVTVGDLKIELLKIPAGSFVMGDPTGSDDERPVSAVKIEKPFWMMKHEVTNELFARFNQQHDSRYEHRTSWIFSEQYLGWRLNAPQQPVVRVSWHEATAFCAWLSRQTGVGFALPTEAQWEYACRAGSDTPLWYGGLDADFSKAANVADVNIRRLAYEGWRPLSPDIVPRDARFDDGALVTAAVGSYKPNAWGLFDMAGNAAEWTRSRYAAYPYSDGDGRNDPAADGPRVVRGGSWYDRPARCRSAFRLPYQPYQRVFNVGFRAVCESP